MLPAKVQQAHDTALETWPEFSRFASVSWVSDRKIESAFETDGGDIHYNPNVLDQMTDEEAAFAAAHTFLHVGLLHRQRRGEKEEKKWHTACDLVVNDILKDRMSLPEGAVYDPKYSGRSAEDIYEELPDDEDEQPQGGDDPGQGLNMGGLASKDGDEDGYYTGKSKQASKEAAKDGDRISDVAGKLPGNEPMAALRDVQARRAKHLKRLTPNWMSGMAQTMRLKIGTSLMDRRFFAEELYLDNYDEDDRVLIAIDTSGSVDDAQVRLFLRCAQGIMEELQASATVLMVDTRIHSETDLEPGDPLPRVVGRGGTSFVPVIEYAARAPAGRYQAAFYFTDAYGTFGDNRPTIPFTWVVWPGGGEVPEGYGDVINMETEDTEDDED